MKKILLSVLALLAMVGSGTAQNLPSYVPTNGLVGWWPFNGNANDESGNGNNGTVNGPQLTENRFGNPSSAFLFSGNQTITIPSNTQLNLSHNYAISLWYYPTQVPNPAVDLMIKGVNDYTGRPYYLRHHGPSNASQGFAFRHASGEFPAALSVEVNTSLPAENNWHHVIISIRDSLTTLYINGVPKDTVLFTGFQGIINNNDLKIGGGYYQFNGKIDDIAFWNRPLTFEEINALYNTINCANDLSLTPASLNLNSGSTASFSASTTDPNPVYRWQSDLGLGFQDLSNYGQYSGVGSNSLQVSNLQLRNHQQKFRVISTSGNCVDTSAAAIIALNDTCINVVNDTNFITVTDTLLINITTASGLVQNTLKAYPNPTEGMLFINTGNYAAMPGYSIRISSVTGQEVYNAVVNQALLQVPLATLSPEGLFYLRLYDASGGLVTTRKIVFAP